MDGDFSCLCAECVSLNTPDISDIGFLEGCIQIFSDCVTRNIDLDASLVPMGVGAAIMMLLLLRLVAGEKVWKRPQVYYYFFTGRHRPVRRKERHEQRTPYYAGGRRRYCVQSAGKHASDGKENR